MSTFGPAGYSPFLRDGTDGRMELVTANGIYDMPITVLLQIQAVIAEHVRKLILDGSIILPR